MAKSIGKKKDEKMRFKRSKHNLSHYVNLTCNMGEIIPVACVEVFPSHDRAPVIKSSHDDHKRRFGTKK